MFYFLLLAKKKGPDFSKIRTWDVHQFNDDVYNLKQPSKPSPIRNVQ